MVERKNGRIMESEIKGMLGYYYPNNEVTDLKQKNKNLFNLVNRVAKRDGVAVSELLSEKGFVLTDQEMTPQKPVL